MPEQVNGREDGECMTSRAYQGLRANRTGEEYCRSNHGQSHGRGKDRTRAGVGLGQGPRERQDNEQQGMTRK